MSRSKADKLKAARGQLVKTNTKLADLRSQQKAINSELLNVNRKKKNLESDINKLQESFKTPVVSDHAVVRYFERVLGVNMSDIHEEILKASAHDNVIKNNTVITLT